MNSIQSSLSNVMTQFESLSQSISKHNHSHTCDKYILNRLDSIDSLLYSVSEIIEEIDMSIQMKDIERKISNDVEYTTTTGHNGCTEHDNITSINNDVYNEKLKHYILNKKIMKELMPLYCALWLRYQ